jgi:hypothetical protein
VKSIYWVLILIGTLAAITSGIAIYFFFQSQDLVNNGTSTKGTIVDLRHEVTDKSGVYYPVVKFQSSTGDVLEVKTSFGSSPPTHKIGDSVEIFYDKNNPKRWTINHPFYLYFLVGIFGFFGVLLTIATIVVLFATIRGRTVHGTAASKRL